MKAETFLELVLGCLEEPRSIHQLSDLARIRWVTAERYVSILERLGFLEHVYANERLRLYAVPSELKPYLLRKFAPEPPSRGEIDAAAESLVERNPEAFSSVRYLKEWRDPILDTVHPAGSTSILPRQYADKLASEKIALAMGESEGQTLTGKPRASRTGMRTR